MSRRDALRRALFLSVLSIVLGGIVGGTAVVVGLASASLSLLGFGFDAAIDAAASVALVWRFLIEGREPDRAERVEEIAETVVGVVLLLLALYLAVNAAAALVSGSHPDSTLVGTILLLFSVVALPPLAFAKYRTARSLASGALRADSILTAVAALLALISLAGLLAVELLGVTWADAVGALAVSALLARQGWSSLLAIRRGARIPA